MIPLRGDEPLSIVDSFRRIFMLLSAGLFLPGSIGIPDPCEESDDGIHDNLALHHCDELTRNAQTILQLLHLGAFKDVLHIPLNEDTIGAIVYTPSSWRLSIVPLFAGSRWYHTHLIVGWSGQYVAAAHICTAV
eukprot:Em0010g319a